MKPKLPISSLLFGGVLILASALILGALARPARAADVLDHTNGTAVIRTGNISTITQYFYPGHYNFSKFTFLFGTHDGAGGHFPNATTTIWRFYSNGVEIASTSKSCEFGQSSGEACTWEPTPIHVNQGFENYYYLTITFPSALSSFYAGVYGDQETANCASNPGGPFAGLLDPYSCFYYDSYYDDTSYDYPDGEAEQTAVVLDAETFFSTELKYKFETDKWCLSEHPEVPCDLKFWFSRPALGQKLYMWYGQNGQIYADTGIVGSTTPTNFHTLTATVTLESVATTSSFIAEYCAQAIATSTLETYQACNIKVAWLSDNDYAYAAEEMAASSSLAERRAGCDCTETSGLFACGIQKSMCYLFIPDAEDVMRIYKLKQKARDSFPFNIYTDIQDTFYALSASSSPTSTMISTASTTGIYMYWNGTITNVPFLTPSIVKNGASTLVAYAKTWLGYGIYFVLFFYLFHRLREMSRAG